MKRNIMIIGIVVVIVWIVVGFFSWQRMAASATTTARAQIAAVERGTLVATVSAAGNVSALKSASLAPQTSGSVTQVNVQVGDNVKAGQTLIQLDMTDLELALKKAQSALASAQANYANAVAKNSQNNNQLLIAQATLDKAKATLAQAQADYNIVAWQKGIGASAQAATLQQATLDYQAAQANYSLTVATINDTELRTAQAALTRAKLDVQQAQNNLDKAKITAPFDGVVGAVNFNVGDNAGSGQAAIVIADLTSLQIKVMLAEVEVVQVKVGQSAHLSLDALPGQMYIAEVAAIGPVGTIMQGVVNYPLYLNVKNVDTAIKPGMTANMNIVVDRRENVLLIPSRAVRTQGNQRVVTVLYQGQQIPVPVSIGLTSDTMVEITSGLREGDQVVLPQTQTRQPIGALGPGMPGGMH